MTLSIQTKYGAGQWLCRKRRVPENLIKLRLFMFPPAGSDIAVYQRWEKYFPAEIEICLICLPGRGGRMNEPLIDECNLLVCKIVDAVKNYFDLPYVLFGHSMGALLAYETAVLAQKSGLRLPERLFLSSLKSPNYMDTSRECFSGLTESDGRLLHLMDDDTLKRKLLEIGGIPDIIRENELFFDFILPTFRSDLKLCETYMPEQTLRLPVPFDVFGGNSDKIASKADLEHWRECSDKEVTITIFPGGHFYFNSAKSIFMFNLSKRLYEVLNTLSGS